MITKLINEKSVLIQLGMMDVKFTLFMTSENNFDIKRIIKGNDAVYLRVLYLGFELRVILEGNNM